MSTVAVRAARLTKRYGGVCALDGLDLEVGVGEVHAFLGPNGAGKTTTIRILLGLLRKDGWAAAHARDHVPRVPDGLLRRLQIDQGA